MRRLILAGMSCLAVLCVVRAQEGPSSAPDTKTPAAPAPKSEEPPAAPSPRAGEPKLDTLTLRETRPCVFSPRIPAEYLRDHQAKQLATARLSLDLDKAGVLELAYGEERTQAPVIAAFVDEKESESKLDTELYRSRADRSMLLVFTVKSAPKNFGAYTLLIEHTQVNEAGEQAVKS
ncbi:MAG: hypothetical protein L6Q71_03250, partial [Planctomycetes bacterium]|nr:hypothetical protein [Planctomycetota bacterium]